MDLEAGRCRRTDGKKWRCSKDVLPDQKYCERHMHRGCQRSRKHVEVTEKVTKSNISPKTVFLNKTPQSIRPAESANKVSNSSLQPPEVIQPIHHPSSHTSYKVCSAATLICTTSPNILSNSKSSIVARVYDIPSMGVLQSGAGCATPTGALTENEPQRCRRTDGRKWRCSSDVLSTQKYCVQHIHRGVKKLATASNPVAIALSPLPIPIIKNLKTGSTHGMLMSDDGTRTSGSSSSDATTITDDENTSDSCMYIIRARDSNIQTLF